MALEGITESYANDLRHITTLPVIAALNFYYYEDDDFDEMAGISCRFAVLGPRIPRLQNVLQEGYAEAALVERLTNPEQQLKSLIESEASRTVILRDASGRQRDGALPLRRRRTAEIALWLDKYRLSDLLIANSFSGKDDHVVADPSPRKPEVGE